MKKLFLLVALLAVSMLPLQALSVFTDNPGVTTGWSNGTTYSSGDGVVHGRFAGQSFAKTISLSGAQTSVTLSFRYWLIDSWDVISGDYGYAYINNNVVWKAHTPTAHDGGVVIDVGSGVAGNYSGSFYNPWDGDRATEKRYVDVSITYATTATSLEIKFASSLDQAIDDEAFAVNRIVVEDDTVIPEPASFTLAFIALSMFFVINRKK